MPAMFAASAHITVYRVFFMPAADEYMLSV